MPMEDVMQKWLASQPALMMLVEKVEELRLSTNESLSRFEPIVVVIATILCWIVLKHAGWLLLSAHKTLAEQGLKITLTALAFAVLKLIPGANAYIHKEQNKLQSSMKAKRECWRTELPLEGLGNQVIVSLDTQQSLQQQKQQQQQQQQQRMPSLQQQQPTNQLISQAANVPASLQRQQLPLLQMLQVKQQQHLQQQQQAQQQAQQQQQQQQASAIQSQSHQSSLAQQANASQQAQQLQQQQVANQQAQQQRLQNPGGLSQPTMYDLQQRVFPEISTASVDSSGHSAGASVLDHRDIVWPKLQVLKDKYLQDMKDLYGMLTTRSTMPMPPENLQKLKHYKDVLHRMIPYLTVPKERVPRELDQDKVEAFEKQVVIIMETFKRRRQPAPTTSTTTSIPTTFVLDSTPG